MCDPVSLMVASTAMGATSSIFGGIAKSNQDQYSAQVATQNANLAQRQADVATQQGVDQQTQLYRKIGATAGAQTAGFAAAGLDPTFGSAASSIVDTSVLGEEDAQRQRNNVMNTVNGYMVDKSNDLSQASADRAASGNDMFSGVLSAGSTIIGGASQIAKYQAMNGPIAKGVTTPAGAFNGWYGSTGGR